MQGGAARQAAHLRSVSGGFIVEDSWPELDQDSRGGLVRRTPDWADQSGVVLDGVSRV